MAFVRKRGVFRLIHLLGQEKMASLSLNGFWFVLMHFLGVPNEEANNYDNEDKKRSLFYSVESEF